jgi:hypothetical protein
MIKSLTLVVFLACTLVAVRADDNDGYPDYACDLCAAVIKDFTPELKSTVLQDVSYILEMKTTNLGICSTLTACATTLQPTYLSTTQNVKQPMKHRLRWSDFCSKAVRPQEIFAKLWEHAMWIRVSRKCFSNISKN